MRSPERQGASRRSEIREPLGCLTHLPFASPDELTVYKVQNLQWTADFSGDVTLTWMRPKKMPSATCVYNVYYRWALAEGDGTLAARVSGNSGPGRDWLFVNGVRPLATPCFV